MNSKKKNIQQQNILKLVLGLTILMAVNMIGSYFFMRFDLSSEKRYTLSRSTKAMLRNLDDYMTFNVYLEGDFPAGFKRLRNSTREMLDEFRAYSNFVQYEFINPATSEDMNERKAIQEELVREGLNPTQLNVSTTGERRQQIIFPGAVVEYKQKKTPLQLLASQIGQTPETVLNNSIQDLEYNISSAIRRLTATSKPNIAFIQGHSELKPLQIAAAREALSEYYTVELATLEGKLNSLTSRTEIDSLNYSITNSFAAIIIAKPLTFFDEKDKFIIDQYIMRGGKVLWLIDPVFASMDSLQNADQTVGISYDVNLRDQLFRYGVKLNSNLVMDLNSVPIPIVTGTLGNQPQYTFYPWYFFPLLNAGSNHPIVNNINGVMGHFSSTIEMVDVPGIEKTILLSTSQYSRAVNTPVLISLEILKEEPDETLFNSAHLPVAVLLEGEFRSLYNNRIPPEISEDRGIGFLDQSQPTAMIVVADGDMIRNQVHFSQGFPFPLGYDQFTRQQYGNKEFLLNAINYLTDDSGLISVRSREVTLRSLDRVRAQKNKILWQLGNTLVPILIIVVIGIILQAIRKRKYTVRVS
ncbi:MAG: gliding motility-associated ABC transporter substrate-binding protein GldG [Bacteroidales bacterium]|nr:gliding motility-associated ABC transporter substrate-binding protein GldG [Bacteroidales bacterium]MDZ4204126.1 gliding motility-associated ABC transporter substrate-binding protein GldG [Bacteroidales bacterium]